MSRSMWILGFSALLLITRAVQADDASMPAQSAVVAAVTADPGPTALAPLQPADQAVAAATCTPGAFRLCCPFPQGCSCRGTQECDADGEWGTCQGAGPRGQPCP